MTDVELMGLVEDSLRDDARDDFLLRGFRWETPPEHQHLGGKGRCREFRIAQAARRHELIDRLPIEMQDRVRAFYRLRRRGL